MKQKARDIGIQVPGPEHQPSFWEGSRHRQGNSEKRGLESLFLLKQSHLFVREESPQVKDYPAYERGPGLRQRIKEKTMLEKEGPERAFLRKPINGRIIFALTTNGEISRKVRKASTH